MTRERLLVAIFTFCRDKEALEIEFIVDFLILITGVLSNIALLWLFLRERKPLSASQVLGMNIVVMDLFYLSVTPAWLVLSINEGMEGNQTSEKRSLSDLQRNQTIDPIDVARESFNMFNLIGCPLLLSCMCMERYLAVVRPVLYLKLRKWEYRVAVSAVVWVITLSFFVAVCIQQDSTPMLTPVSLIISCLFILMLTSLCGVIRSLLQQSPAHTKVGNPASSSAPLRRRAVCNVLAVVVPAVIAYLPILPLAPLVIYIQYHHDALNSAVCDFFFSAVLFPRLGVFVGPLFYLSRARQMCKCL